MKMTPKMQTTSQKKSPKTEDKIKIENDLKNYDDSEE